MRHVSLLLLLLSACSHDTSALRDGGTPDANVDGAMVRDSGTDAARDASADTGMMDTGMADTGVADTGIADSGVDTGVADSGAPDAGFRCEDFTFESATPGVGTSGIFMSQRELHVWRFQTTRRFRIDEVGFTAEALDGAGFQGGVFRLTGPGDDPDGLDFATADVIDAARTVAPAPTLAGDIVIPMFSTPVVEPGWYAVGVALETADTVQFHGNTPGGMRPYRIFSGGSSSTGARRLFVRGCLELP